MASLEQRCQLRQEGGSDDPSICDALALARESTPSTPCLQRRRVADELINTSPDLLEDTTLKIRILFYDQLVSTQSIGCVSVERATCMLTPGKLKQ